MSEASASSGPNTAGGGEDQDVLAPAREGELVAYELAPNPGYVIEPAPPKREWMDKAPGRTPYRCLPMVIANQAGWVVRCPGDFSVTWNGKVDPGGLNFKFPDEATSRAGFVASNFGMGIITFRFPWLFRTARGTGLWVHGPVNEPKDNLAALEGLVETDWLESPFTMNWKIQRRGAPVYFRKGDVLCTLTPFPLDELQSVAPKFRMIAAAPDLMTAVGEAQKRRLAMVDQQQGSLDGDTPWERTYMKGVRIDGTKLETHRTTLKLREFERED